MDVEETVIALLALASRENVGRVNPKPERKNVAAITDITLWTFFGVAVNMPVP
jgi:hypothetical protein